MTCSTTVNRPLRGPLAVRILELQPGLFSKISESFNVLHPMIPKRLHSCRAEDQPLPGIAASDTHIGFWGGEWNVARKLYPSARYPLTGSDYLWLGRARFAWRTQG